MALTRARTIAGDAGFQAEVEGEVAATLAGRRDVKKLFREAVEMRDLIGKEKPPRDAWDLKLVAGGLIDLEFIAQAAVLAGAVDGPRRSTMTGEMLARLAPSLADPHVRQELVAAHGLFSTLTQIMRLCLTGDFSKEDAPPGLTDLLLRATDLPDLAILEAHLEETARQVRKHFDRLLRSGRG